MCTGRRRRSPLPLHGHRHALRRPQLPANGSVEFDRFALFHVVTLVPALVDSKSRLQPTARMLVTDKESIGNALGGETCLTSGCVRAAADFLRNMDNSVDPCNDFYRFSCGTWVDSQVIPDDRTSVSIFSLLQDDLNNKLRGWLKFIMSLEMRNHFPRHACSVN